MKYSKKKNEDFVRMGIKHSKKGKKTKHIVFHGIWITCETYICDCDLGFNVAHLAGMVVGSPNEDATEVIAKARSNRI